MLDTPVKRLYPNELLPPIPNPEVEQALWKRLSLAVAVVGLAIVGIGVGTASISYRLTHLHVEGGVVNGRLVRLRAPIAGKLQDFYGRPGARVQAQQIVARIMPAPQEKESLLKLQGEVQVNAVQLESGRQTLVFLQQQLAQMERQDVALKQAHVAIADKDVEYHQSGVNAENAQVAAARLEYERYNSLLAEGAVSRQKVDELRAVWQSAEAKVRQAQASLDSSETSLDALASGIPLNPGATLANQRLNLMQAIQDQVTLVHTLEAQLASKKQRLLQVQTQYGDRKTLEIKAPFAGVVYRTERELGELVSRPDNLLTLLDCNDLWIENWITAEQARRIDVQNPVRVQLAGDTNTYVGEIELIEPVSSIEMVRQQVQAIIPPVPPNLSNQPLARVTVRIPPSSDQAQAHQFCGVGKSANLTFGMKLFAQ
ncbi:MAG: HlyD family secretion protein [Scytolyngbya sp. HA4215-MV1]|jgi:multidrug resistance efflux pump|nr:HlyD family secretion protein [Scytolyngbya sp. HA4215-MV1]